MRQLWRAVAGASLVAAQRPHVELAAKQAKELVTQGAFKGDRTYGLFAEKDNFQPLFWDIEATWNNPRGSMIAGHFAVNARTGTLWNLEGSVCNVITSARLERYRATLSGALEANLSISLRLSRTRPMECSIIGRTRASR